MPALAIVRSTIAKAVGFAQLLGKAPALVGEGVPAALVENMARQAGMRVPRTSL